MLSESFIRFISNKLSLFLNCDNLLPIFLYFIFYCWIDKRKDKSSSQIFYLLLNATTLWKMSNCWLPLSLPLIFLGKFISILWSYKERERNLSSRLLQISKAQPTYYSNTATANFFSNTPDPLSTNHFYSLYFLTYYVIYKFIFFLNLSLIKKKVISTRDLYHFVH